MLKETSSIFHTLFGGGGGLFLALAYRANDKPLLLILRNLSYKYDMHGWILIVWCAKRHEVFARTGDMRAIVEPLTINLLVEFIR